VDFISDLSPRYERELRYVPNSGRAAKAAQRIIYRYTQAPRERGAWMRMRRAPRGF